MDCKGSLSLIFRGKIKSRVECQSKLKRVSKTSNKGTYLRSEAMGREPGKRSRTAGIKSRKVESKKSLGHRPLRIPMSWYLSLRCGIGTQDQADHPTLSASPYISYFPSHHHTAPLTTKNITIARIFQSMICRKHNFLKKLVSIL